MKRTYKICFQVVQTTAVKSAPLFEKILFNIRLQSTQIVVLKNDPLQG
jgi:hypothetical protein